VWSIGEVICQRKKNAELEFFTGTQYDVVSQFRDDERSFGACLHMEAREDGWTRRITF
jgi:hypothetical protein